MSNYKKLHLFFIDILYSYLCSLHSEDRHRLLTSSFGMLKENQKMSDIYFHSDITLVNGTTLQGSEWPSVPWYLDTSETGAALLDLSWFIKICQGLFPRVCAIQDFPYPSRLHLAHHIKLWRTSDIIPLWGAYVKYPLPTECGTSAMATGRSPHIKGSLSPWTQTK